MSNLSEYNLQNIPLINPNGYYETAGGLMLPKSTRKPRAFDFFAGCGGFSLGFIRAGWNVVGMNEISFHAILTYCVNLSKQPMNLYWDTEERGAELNKFLKKHVFTKNNKYFKTCHFFHESEKLTFPTIPGTGWILSQELFRKNLSAGKKHICRRHQKPHRRHYPESHRNETRRTELRYGRAAMPGLFKSGGTESRRSPQYIDIRICADDCGVESKNFRYGGSAGHCQLPNTARHVRSGRVRNDTRRGRLYGIFTIL